MPPTTVNDRGSSKSPVGHTINEILGLKEQYSSESESSGSSTENSGSDHERSPSPGAGTQQASSAEHQADGLQHRQGKTLGGININTWSLCYSPLVDLGRSNCNTTESTGIANGRSTVLRW